MSLLALKTEEALEGEYIGANDLTIDEIEVQIPEKLMGLFDPWRFKALHGGRGGAKSRSIAAALIAMSQQVPLRILCVREVQNSIRDSVKRVLDDEIGRQKANNFFTSLDTRIVAPNGTEFIFEGLRHNYDKIKSYEGIDICWVEEAHTCSQISIDTLEPTIRKAGSEIWYSWNPRFPGDPVHKKFKGPDGPPPRSLVIEINHKDNPWFPAELHEHMMYMKEKDYEKYLHVYEGQPIGDGGAIIFPIKWIQAAINLDISDEGVWKAGLDVADEGDDSNALTIAKGPVVKSMEEWHEGNTTQTARKTYGILRDRGIKSLNYDSIGVGAGVKGEFWSLNSLQYQINAVGVNVGLPPNDDEWEPGMSCKDMFLNLKAELYFRLRRRFEKTYEYVEQGADHKMDDLISISDDPDLVTELTQLHYEIMDSGKIKIESKKKLAARGIKSPNKAESLILCMAPNMGLSYLDAM